MMEPRKEREITAEVVKKKVYLKENDALTLGSGLA